MKLSANVLLFCNGCVNASKRDALLCESASAKNQFIKIRTNEVLEKLTCEIQELKESTDQLKASRKSADPPIIEKNHSVDQPTSSHSINASVPDRPINNNLNCQLRFDGFEETD